VVLPKIGAGIGKPAKPAIRCGATHARRCCGQAIAAPESEEQDIVEAWNIIAPLNGSAFAPPTIVDEITRARGPIARRLCAS